MRMLLAVTAALALAGPAAAHEVRKGDIVVVHPLLRATLGRAPNTAGYLTLKNTGRTADRLVSAACACARSVKPHAVSMMGAMASMRELPGLDVPAGGEVVLKPGGSHLMLFGLKRPLEPGTVVSLTLRFQRAGTVTVPFFVTSRVEAEMAAHAGGAHGAHQH